MSALDGVLEAGDIVWQQMYSPTHPAWDSTLEERIAGGVLYGGRTQMRLISIYRDGVDGPCQHADENGLHLLSGKPIWAHSEHYVTAVLGREGDGDHYSITDDNWCVLEHAEAGGGLW